MDDIVRCNGKSPNHRESMFKIMYNSCKRIVDKDPDNLVIHYDLESGYPEVRTKEWQDSFIKLLESCKPVLKEPINFGKIIVYGTGVDIEGKDNWYDIFTKEFNNQKDDSTT
jgi:hypothetical protein